MAKDSQAAEYGKQLWWNFRHNFLTFHRFLVNHKQILFWQVIIKILEQHLEAQKKMFGRRGACVIDGKLSLNNR